MATILFYSPFNQRSRDTESLMLAFHKQGHRIISLSQQEAPQLHEFLRAHNIESHSFFLGEHGGWLYYLRHLLYLIRFCFREKVDVVYSHLEPANFVAAVANYFVKAKVYVCRHHIDEGSLYAFDRDLYYRLTYKLARKIIVVSEHSRDYMIKKEGVRDDKILHINLAYDFSLYAIPDPLTVQKIRKDFSCDVLLLSACRLTQFKRPDISIQTLKLLLEKGVDAKLIILGRGEMKEELLALIDQLSLQERVVMPGYVSNVLEYISACDFFIHPSVLDSSCVAVKEAGLVSKPFIACAGIGDFSDYIVHNRNGLLVDAANFQQEAAALIFSTMKDQEFLSSMGKALKGDVIRLFSIENVLPAYTELNNSGGNGIV